MSDINSPRKANGGHKYDAVALMTGCTIKADFKQYHSFYQIIAESIGKESPVKSLVLRGDPYRDKKVTPVKLFIL